MTHSPTRRNALQVGAAGGLGLSAAALLAACSGSSQTNNAGSSGGNGPYPKMPRWEFTYVLPDITDSFFVPVKYGAEDAASLLGATIAWQGSKTSALPEMISIINAAIDRGTHGLAINMIDSKAFVEVTNKALAKGIPVVDFNSNAKSSVVPYVGMDKYSAGHKVGEQAAKLIDSGRVMIGISLPGSLANTPTLSGFKDAVKQSGKNLTLDVIALTIDPNQGQSRVDAYYQGHKDVKGMFGMGSIEAQDIGKVIKKYDLKIPSGGLDLLPATIQLIKDGHLGFVVDELPYYQGFLPTLYMYMSNMTGGIIPTINTDTTAPGVVDKSVINKYLEKSRFIGTSADYIKTAK